MYLHALIPEAWNRVSIFESILISVQAKNFSQEVYMDNQFSRATHNIESIKFPIHAMPNQPKNIYRYFFCIKTFDADDI